MYYIKEHSVILVLNTNMSSLQSRYSYPNPMLLIVYKEEIMMEDTKLKILDRDEKGTSAARNTRREGFVPGVLYGMENLSQPVKVENASLKRIISRMGSSAIFDAEYDREPKLIMLKEVQNEPVSGEILHVDLFEISADEAIATAVPLSAVGIEGIGEGGVLQQMMNELQISCLPRFVPNMIEFDVAGLHIGDAVYVSDLKLGEEVEVLDDLEDMVANIIEPKEIIEEEEEEEDEEMEVEMEEGAETDEEEVEGGGEGE